MMTDLAFRPSSASGSSNGSCRVTMGRPGLPVSGSPSSATSCRRTAGACTSRARSAGAAASRSICRASERVAMARVLVVDDDIGIRTHLATYVRDLGHEVEVAKDAFEALAAMAARAYDVVISDVRMAGMDGLSLLREIRLRHPETGVILMTAYATVPDAVEAMRRGAFDYLVKPFSLAQAGFVLGRLLEVQTLRAIEANRPAPPTAKPPGSLRELERVHVERILAEAATLEEAAARLGVNTTTLWRMRKRWGLE